MFVNRENVLLQGSQTGRTNPRTPGPSNFKTPFKIPVNDENGLETIRKTGGPKNLFAGNPEMFITPVGPRKPLAGKTTNVKAPNQAQSAKPSASRPVRGRLSILGHTPPIVHENNKDVPEIEYMPPREQALPDIPDGFVLPDLENLSKNLYTDCHHIYLDEIDEFGKTKVQRQVEESERRIEEYLDRETEKSFGGDKKVATTKPAKKSASGVNVPPGCRPKGLISSQLRGAANKPKKPSDIKRSTSASRSASTVRSSSSLSERQRPPSASTSRPSTANASKSTRHARSASTRSIGPPSTNSRPNSRMRSSSAVNAADTNVGHAAGKKVAKELVEERREESVGELLDRLVKMDDENLDRVTGGLTLKYLANDADEDGEIMAVPVFLEDEEDFFLPIPE
ncbi:hypothetical protein RUND412_009642 [Rhizina undulata]